MATIRSIRVFDPVQGERDGLEFKAEIDKKVRRGFISGSALAVLKDDLAGTPEEIFEVRAPSIALAVSRRAESVPEDDEISISSSDVARPD